MSLPDGIPWDVAIPVNALSRQQSQQECMSEGGERKRDTWDLFQGRGEDLASRCKSRRYSDM